MLKVSRVISFRRQRYSKDVRRPWLKLGVAGALLFCLAVLATSVVGVFYTVSLTRDLPSAEIIPSLLEPPDGVLLQPTRLFDRSGQQVLATLQNPGAVGSQYLFVSPAGQPGVDQASPYLINATLLEFDPDFWSNPGFKLEGLAQASHPTLAQILVSSLVLADEPPSLQRNIRERILAAQLTVKFGREKVLEWYLNSAMYGETVFGADAAARVYFGKPAADLSFAQAAMLTAISQMPAINPWSGSQYLKQQQELIIQKMLVTGLVTGIEAQQALKEEIKFQPQEKAASVTPAFSAYVLAQASHEIPLERLYRGGYEIITTLDIGLQSQADCAAQVQIAHASADQAPVVAPDGTACEAAGLLPELPGGQGSRSGDLAAEIVIIDPQSSQVLAMLGGGNSTTGTYLPTPHPSGTILSPFLYLTAFTRGMSPASLLWDVPPADENENVINPLNVETGEPAVPYHGPVSLREAFVNDYVGAGAEVWQQVGGKNVLQTEAEFGLNVSGEINIQWENFPLQTASLVRVTQAYAVLANQGIYAGPPQSHIGSSGLQDHMGPASILLVREVSGKVLVDWTQSSEIPVTSPQLAYLVSHVLADTNEHRGLPGNTDGSELGRAAAWKTSLDKATGQAWVVGYTPQLAVGVFMDGLSDSNEQAPAGLWTAMMNYSTRQQPAQDFSMPAGVRLVQVCDPTGMLPSPLCPDVVQEVFLDGSEPTQVDSNYRKYYVDRETGLLATIFTPLELVEEKVFLQMPAQVKTWAKSAGLAAAPDEYDSISLPPVNSSRAEITAPQMFDDVRGELSITGSARGEGISYYRLEIGKGLFPQEWIQIGEDITQPVENGLLGTWDTSGLQGLYVVKLMVVNEDYNFEEALLQVTVDNIAPDVVINSPAQGKQYTSPASEKFVLNASAHDDQAVEQVDFYVDGLLVSTVSDPPYVALWNASTGTHTLVVRAFDLAGNQSQSTITFSVSR